MVKLRKVSKYGNFFVLFQHLPYPLTRMPQVKTICIGALDLLWKVGLEGFGIFRVFGTKMVIFSAYVVQCVQITVEPIFTFKSTIGIKRSNRCTKIMHIFSEKISVWILWLTI